MSELPFCKFCNENKTSFIYLIKGFPVIPIVTISNRNCNLYYHSVCGRITPIEKGIVQDE